MLPFRVLATISAALLVSAEIYVINPASGSTCHGGQPCTVTWMDDGAAPLLSTIGVTKVGLYTGHLQLIQTIDSVNVSATHTLTFTPDPKAGPNSNSYYVAFTPVRDISYRGYSPWFSLEGMTGSFSSTGGATSTAVASSTTGATSTLATASSSSAASATSTGTLTTPSTTGSVTSSGFSTAFSSGSSTASHVASSATTTHSNVAVANTVTSTGFTWTLLASCLGLILF